MPALAFGLPKQSIDEHGMNFLNSALEMPFFQQDSFKSGFLCFLRLIEMTIGL